MVMLRFKGRIGVGIKHPPNRHLDPIPYVIPYREREIWKGSGLGLGSKVSGGGR